MSNPEKIVVSDFDDRVIAVFDDMRQDSEFIQDSNVSMPEEYGMSTLGLKAKSFLHNPDISEFEYANGFGGEIIFKKKSDPR